MKIALVGNPNAGKTTLFNILTGSNQFVGNWPGVTVEKKEGKLKGYKDADIIDLPGIYSLSPNTMEEVISRNYLVNERPNAIINIIDGTNLERNLYLTTQIAELGIPMIVAVNMIDIVQKKGNKIHLSQMAQIIGCQVYEISALKNKGCKEVAQAAVDTALEKKQMKYQHRFDSCIEHTLAHIEEAILHNLPEEKQRWYSVKLFERDSKITEQLAKTEGIQISAETLSHIEDDIQKCEKEMDDDSESIIISERYKYIESIIKSCVTKKNKSSALTTSDKIDRIVTNRFLALPIFAVIMWAVYYIAMVTVGAAATDWANDGLFGDGFHLFGIWIPGIPSIIESGLDKINCADWLKGLILDGIVAGVGSVLGFVPQMLVLFLLLAFLEACGYMARIAFIMDRVFRRFGLSGKSFIPMLVGTGCGIPGIMASRTIESERDRRMTIMTTTFIPCGAKTPFIAMIAGAIFGGSAWIATSAYFIGIASILISGIMLKKTKMFSGDVSPFVMELPAYHLPTIGNLLRSMWERGWSFIKKAGTIILLSTIIIWFLSYFGWVDGKFMMIDENQMDCSVLAYIGRAICWIFQPLGFGNWQATVATITGLVAKENIVGTMGILYGGSQAYTNMAQVFNHVTGMSFLIFNLLCAPCFAAMGAIKREMNSKKWFWFAIGYECGFAYIISFIVNQMGKLFTGQANGISDIFEIIIGFVITAALIYMIFRKNTTGQGTLRSRP